MDKQVEKTPARKAKKVSTPSLPEGVQETFKLKNYPFVFLSLDGKDWRFSEVRAIKAFGKDGYKKISRNGISL